MNTAAKTWALALRHARCFSIIVGGEPLLRIHAFAELEPPARRSAAKNSQPKSLNSFAPRWPSK